ncbi:phakinin isoform X1 [Synchiropus splendidus]|uniref:phakinin isoform X1 n=1 Tax=Synchiropus splendidus TaxID=270530 RepID=UPI00237ECAB3|nr:phakinin isoform X1 [Synchiropus splendidus]
MPLPRRRSSFLGQSPADCRPPSLGRSSPDRCPSAPSVRVSRGVFVGTAPQIGGSSGLGTRVSRRALGISSIFLQGMRSSAAPVLSRLGAQGGHSATSAAGLNSCLMEYRDKVRALEQLNQQLEEQIRLSLDRKASSAGAWGPLRREWEDVYRQVSESILENARLMLQTENVQANAEDFKERYESEQPIRLAVEDEIASLYRVIDDANLTKLELEEQMEKMRAELQELDQVHEQDVRNLYSQMSGQEVDQPDAPIETSLDQILDHIRNHWERVTEQSRAETDSYLEYQEAQSVGSRLSPEEQQVETLKAECTDAGIKIQSLQAETESIRALRRGLENSLGDAHHWHDVELQNLGSVVSRLQAELSDVHRELEQQQQDYEALLSNKQRLEQQIRVYHGILDGEEIRYRSTGVQSELEEPPGSDPVTC